MEAVLENILALNVDGLQLHEAADFVPPMRADEWRAFIADVRENGIRDPIVVQLPNVILDGRHRWNAARECGLSTIPARIVDLTSTAQEQYVITSALLRRHLTDNQRAMLALKWQRRASAQAQSEAGKRAVAVRDGRLDEQDRTAVADEVSATARQLWRQTLSCEEVPVLSDVARQHIRQFRPVEVEYLVRGLMRLRRSPRFGPGDGGLDGIASDGSGVQVMAGLSRDKVERKEIDEFRAALQRAGLNAGIYVSIVPLSGPALQACTTGHPTIRHMMLNDVLSAWGQRRTIKILPIPRDPWEHSPADCQFTFALDGEDLADKTQRRPRRARRDTRAEAADLFRVPERAVRYAAEIEKRSPELAKQVERGEKSLLQARREARVIAQAELEQAPLPTGKYRIIYADPPWRYGNMMPEYAPEQADHYPTMTVSEICALPIADLAEDNAVLFLWVTSPILEESFQVIRAWGFQYKSSFVWDKIKHNMGHYNSVRHEFLLVCVRGSCQPDVPKLFDSVLSEERTKHSRKPETFRTIIDTIYPHGRRVELFAREQHEGWDGYGNQL